MMDEVRRFITVENHEAVKMGELEKTLEISLGGEAPKLLRTSMKQRCVMEWMS